jgi:hypothetical protein
VRKLKSFETNLSDMIVAWKKKASRTLQTFVRNLEFVSAERATTTLALAAFDSLLAARR